MYKSNINVVSNVYIREPKSISDKIERLQFDPKFVAQVSGRKALSILKKNHGDTLTGVHLSDAQEKELTGSAPCGNGAKGEITHGKVLRNGIYVYECRCEPENCSLISMCSPKKYDRNNHDSDDEAVDDSSPLNLEWLGINEDTDVFAEPEYIPEIEEDEVIPDDEAVVIEDILSDSEEYKKITADEAESLIISSDINSHILVNAAPGTGKTYTAIQRLLYVLNYTEPENFNTILVLCYTRAAVGEIKKRIAQGISDGTIPYQANCVWICTFDSLATNYLVSIGLTSEELYSINYNQRIQLFNQKIDAEDFDDFTYCIIDELQDLVNDRAIMTLNILKSLSCGYLLLGDRCQSIYDYDCKGQTKVNSTEFYNRLKAMLPSDVMKFELLGNKRQTKALEQKTALLRTELLNFDPHKITAVFRKELYSLPDSLTAESYNSDSEKGSTAILCRNNGEAEYLSWILHKNKVPHSLIRTNGQASSLNRYIADVLWDYNGRKISREDFIKRLTVRCGLKNQQSEAYYNDLCELVFNDVRDYIDCEALAKRLCQESDLPANILNQQNSQLSISTIHKAKGREFDKVYLLGYDYNPKFKANRIDTEEERILYVAETRPRNELEILKKGNRYNWFFKKNSNNRWIRTIRKPYKKQAFCVGFATGLSEDIDYSSFAEGNIIEAVKRQAYISKNVKSGDKVYLQLNNGIYQIVHNETVIGEMSDSYSENLTSKFSGRQYISKLPSIITDLFVTNVITFVSCKDYDNIPQKFRKNRFWLAVEISGFGRTKWTENQ